jgi:hypothetical protein
MNTSSTLTFCGSAANCLPFILAFWPQNEQRLTLPAQALLFTLFFTRELGFLPKNLTLWATWGQFLSIMQTGESRHKNQSGKTLQTTIGEGSLNSHKKG